MGIALRIAGDGGRLHKANVAVSRSLIHDRTIDPRFFQLGNSEFFRTIPWWLGEYLTGYLLVALRHCAPKLILSCSSREVRPPSLLSFEFGFIPRGGQSKHPELSAESSTLSTAALPTSQSQEFSRRSRATSGDEISTYTFSSKNRTENRAAQTSILVGESNCKLKGDISLLWQARTDD